MLKKISLGGLKLRLWDYNLLVIMDPLNFENMAILLLITDRLYIVI